MSGRDFKSRLLLAIIVLAANQTVLVFVLMPGRASDPGCDKQDDFRAVMENIKDRGVRDLREEFEGPIDISSIRDEDTPSADREVQRPQEKANYPGKEFEEDDEEEEEEEEEETFIVEQEDMNLDEVQQKPQLSPPELSQGPGLDWTGFNRTEIENFRKMVLNKTRVVTHLYTCQKNVPVHSHLRFFQSNLTVKIMRGTYKYFPRNVQFPVKPYQTCSVVGNGGVLTGSGCGNEIDSADHVFRLNLPPIQGSFTQDVGNKTNFVTLNPSVLQDGYGLLLEKENISAFMQAVDTYPANTVIYTHPFDQKRYRKPVYRAHQAMRNSEKVMRWSHPEFLRATDSFWKKAFHLTEARITSGLLVTTIALSMCAETNLYGFWPYRTASDGRVLAYHYFDRPISSRQKLIFDEEQMFIQGVLKNRRHNMGDEFSVLRHLHKKGVLRLHVEKCEERS
ncbi:PREDICTED: alpha-N-acetylneuraminide alpha-2,8-sialyltransferase-like [Branchiostoma belcheri]|uniref:Alpha-N-acetylneuraminide alpha-2,8-sialyltransferase-like n=1 Tax=Branchiostoma belcheri TaxID=7741 RepID=A0A6P4XXD8_BRABE|nr:PREDICTED: alpha-N-acetylneuraminide alpha-2,8-sialyltransferase-like [Branchiostoma belcheri]